MAIALLEAGLPISRFSIDAMDISKYAINKAKRAVYSKNSFRGEQLIDLNRYFQSTAEGYELISTVRSTVNFQQGNLLNAFLNTQAKYNIIFCRNLMIYLAPDICSQVMNILANLLLPEGLLFVGASETAKINSDLFTSIRKSFTFAYQKIDTVQLQLPQQQLIKFTESERSSVSFHKEPKQQSPPREKLSASPSHVCCNSTYSPNIQPHQLTNLKTLTTPTKISLDTARELADTGHVEAAIGHCQDYLKHDVMSAEAYTLLGTLYQTKSEYTQAEKYFRKALYLDPDYYEALMHFALLKEHLGDIARAQIIRQRIKKLQQTN
jgi:chemotaxis protein methyltransferase WspC